MATHSSSSSAFQLFLSLALLVAAASAQLSPDYYRKVCPAALQTIKGAVDAAVNREKRIGASLLRLHFHDCFVQGCDGSILLDSTSTMETEKNAGPNRNSLRGFEVVDQIKREVDRACGGPVVSCADILAVAARDSVVALGGPTWEVRLGRRDSATASRQKADTDIPTPFMDLPALVQNFRKQGLEDRDLVALAGAHSVGFAQCQFYRGRIYNTSGDVIDPAFARSRQATCPRNGGDRFLAPLDSSAAKFDAQYFSDLVKRSGLLRSDQALFSGGATDELVKGYSQKAGAFYADFARSMVRLGNIKPLTGTKGQVRENCRKAD